MDQIYMHILVEEAQFAVGLVVGDDTVVFNVIP